MFFKPMQIGNDTVIVWKVIYNVTSGLHQRHSVNTKTGDNYSYEINWPSVFGNHFHQILERVIQPTHVEML